MKVTEIVGGVLLLMGVAIIAMMVPTLVWSVTTLNRHNDYPYYVMDINNRNNGGEYLHEGIIKQNSLLVKKFHTDTDGNIVLTDYAYQDGAQYIEVVDEPLTIPILKAHLGSRN
jgi:hypothetical protein